MAIGKLLFRTKLRWTEWLDPYMIGHAELFRDGHDFAVRDKSHGDGRYAAARLFCFIQYRLRPFTDHYSFP